MEIDIPPGVVRTISPAAAQGRYDDAQWVRFTGGFPQKIGGWEELFSTNLTGVARAAWAYRGPAGFEIRAFGTEQKLYAADINQEPEDITPIRATSTINTDPFAVVDTDNTVTVTDTAHGALQGDTVHFSGATAGGGITINGTYLITAVIDDDSYTIEHSAPATSTDATTGGASVVADYEINIGTVSQAESGGYGVGPYGAEEYGTERTLTSITIDERHWSLGNYGDNLIAAYQGGTIYLYDPDTMDEAEALTNAPTDVRYAFVTEERFIFALRAAMVVSWPDRDVPTTWTPAVTNTANTRTLGSGNKLIAGTALGGGISLVWTDTSLYRFQYTGGTFVYDSQMVGFGYGLIGPHAFAIGDGLPYWISRAGLHLFTGGVQAIPNADTHRDWVFDNLTPGQGSKSFAWFNQAHREIWFEVPLFGATEPSHYVAVNIDTFDWTSGTLARVGGALSQTAGPILMTVAGDVYRHEIGLNGNGAAIAWNYRSGLWRIPSGEKSVDIFGFSPDADIMVGNVSLSAFAQDRPLSATQDTDTAILTPTTEMADLRLSGRYFGFSMSQEVIDGDYRGGVNVLEVQDAGARR